MWPIRDTTLKFALKDWVKPSKISIRIANDSAEIQTEHHPNKILNSYRYTNPFGN
jgi:hypothetical protein